MEHRDPLRFWKIITVIGLFSHAIGLWFLPDAFFNDTAFHIANSLKLAALDFDGPLSLYYLFSAVVYVFLPAIYPFTKIIPALITLALFYVSIRYFTIKLGGDAIIAFAFFVNFSAFIRYSSINLLGQLSALLLLLVLYWYETGHPSRAKVGLFSTLLVQLTNLPLVIGALLRHELKWVLTMIGGVYLLVLYADILSGFPAGLNALNPLVFLATFFDFPPPSFPLFSAFNYFALSIPFILVLLPLYLSLVAGFLKIRMEHQYFLYMLFAVLLVSLTDSRMMGNINWRHLTVVMPLLGLFFAQGFQVLKHKKWVKSSMAFYAIYSWLMILLSSWYYQGWLTLP